MGTSKRTMMERGRLWKLSAKQARRTQQNFMAPRDNRYMDANKRAGKKRTCRTRLEKNIKNDLAQPSSSRLNNASSRLGKGVVLPQKNIKKPKHACLVTPQKHVGMVPPQKNTEKFMTSPLRPIPPQKNNEKFMTSPLRPNDGPVSRPKDPSSSPRLNNGKIPMQRKRENATCISSRPNNGLGYPREYTKKPMPSSSRTNNCVVSSQKEREFSSRSNNGHGSVSLQKNVKKPQPSSSTPNNELVYPHDNTKKRKPSSVRPDNGGASSSKNIKMPKPSPSRTNNDMISSLNDIAKSMPSSARPDNAGASSSKNIEMPRPSPSRTNIDMISSSKDIVKSMPSSSSPNGGSVPPLKNVKQSMSVKSRPSRLRGEFSSRKPPFTESKDDSYSNLSISNKSPPSLVHHKPFDAERSTQVQSEELWKAMEASNSGLALKGNQVVQGLQPNCRPNKRMRKDEGAGDDNGDKNPVVVESGTAVIIETADINDCHTEPSPHFISESWELPQYSSLPIDQHIWSGIIKTCKKEYVSLAAHLSTKYCERVSKLSRSLQPVLTVTKLSRLDAWPKSFVTSGPTDDNIALYFFPQKMRQDADLDQLVEEVVENDMVLRAVVDEAELLIFPSVLLPEQFRTFQGKTYLWGVFRPRQEKFAIVEEHVIGHYAQEEKGKQNASHCGVGKNTGVGLEAPEEADEQGMEPEQTPLVAQPNTPIPVEDVAAQATSAPTMPASVCANDGQIHPSFSFPAGTVLGFVVRQTPKLDHLIEELQREGSVVVAMRGEMVGSGLDQAMPTGVERTQSSS